MKRPVSAPTTLLGGIARLALFNRSGFAAIGDTTQAFLTSLAPLLAFLIVGCATTAAQGHWRVALTDLLQTLCVLLGQPVLSNLLARRWGREAQWLRYATAMNWCQLAIPVVAVLLTTAAILLGVIGPSPQAAFVALLAAIVIYALPLNWFLAWRGLDLSPARAALLVILVTAGLALLLAGPAALRQTLGPATTAGITT